MSDTNPTPTPELPPGRGRKHAKTKGIGSVYQRGQTWWISYSINGVRERESSQSENRADAVRLLKDRLGRIGRHEPTGAASSRTPTTTLCAINCPNICAPCLRSPMRADGGSSRNY
jgi:hypothetical protein